jgi:DNA-binding XRE family transcriptional regulator
LKRRRLAAIGAPERCLNVGEPAELGEDISDLFHGRRLSKYFGERNKKILISKSTSCLHDSLMPRPAGSMKLSPFGTRLEMARVQSGYESQSKFAKAIDVSPQRYSSWINGVAEPNIAMLGTIRMLTRIDLNWLVAGEAPTSTTQWRAPANTQTRISR